MAVFLFLIYPRIRCVLHLVLGVPSVLLEVRFISLFTERWFDNSQMYRNMYVKSPIEGYYHSSAMNALCTVLFLVLHQQEAFGLLFAISFCEFFSEGKS